MDLAGVLRIRNVIQSLPPEHRQLFDGLLDIHDDDVPRPDYLPASLAEALGRYVFPGFRVNSAARPPSFIAPASRGSTNPAPYLGDEHSLTLFLQHAPLLDHLNDIVSSTIADLPASSPTVHHWTRRYVNSYEPLLNAPVAYEDDLSAVGIPFLAYPINCLLYDDAAFVGTREPYPAKWQRPLQATKLGLTDWVCTNASSSNISGSTRAVLEWKRADVLPTEAFSRLLRPQLKEGFNMTLPAKGPIVRPRLVGLNLAKAIFQLWGQAHHYGCRWLALFNTEAMCVFFLADERRLFYSDLIYADDAEHSMKTTFASVLFGLGLLVSPPLPAPGATPPAPSVNYRTIPLEAVALLELNAHDAVPAATPTEADPAGATLPSYSVPPQFRQFGGMFTRYDPDRPSSSPSSSSSCGRIVTVRVGPHFSRGRLWSAFAATIDCDLGDLHKYSGLRLEWASTSSSIRAHTPSGSPHKSSVSSTPSLSPAKSADTDDKETQVVLRLASTGCNAGDQDSILNEACIYSGPGLALQGTTLPRWGGLFVCETSDACTWASILEDVGACAPSRSEALPGFPFEEMYARDVLRKFESLHAAGIAHGDLERRHVRVGKGAARLDPEGVTFLPPGADLGLRLIDLDQASTAADDVEIERTAVRNWLGLSHTY